MRRLSAAFIQDHLEDHLLVSINHLFWIDTSYAFMNHILEEDEHPAFSEEFYQTYGNEICIKNMGLVRAQDVPPLFLDLNVDWCDFVLDLLDFILFAPFHDVKQRIAEAFLSHYDDVVLDEDEREQEAFKRLSMEDTRLARLFRLRDICNTM